MRNDDVPKMKKPHVTMQAARLRVLRTSRLFLLPAIALSLTACTENAVADAVTDIRQKADEMRGSANAVFDPAATLADSRRYDDDRDTAMMIVMMTTMIVMIAGAPSATRTGMTIGATAGRIVTMTTMMMTMIVVGVIGTVIVTMIGAGIGMTTTTADG